MAEDEASLRRAFQAIGDGIRDAYNNNQFEDIAKFLTKNCVLIAPGVPTPLQGPRAVIDFNKTVMKKLAPRCKHITTLQAQLVSPNFAIGTGTNAQERRDGSVFGHGRHLSMMKKVNGKWLGYKFMYTYGPDKLHSELQDWCANAVHNINTNPKDSSHADLDDIIYPPAEGPVVGRKAAGEHNVMLLDAAQALGKKFSAEVVKSLYLNKETSAVHIEICQECPTTGSKDNFGTAFMIMKKREGKWQQFRCIYSWKYTEKMFENKLLMTEMEEFIHKLFQNFLNGKADVMSNDLSTEDVMLLPPGVPDTVKGREALAKYNTITRGELQEFDVKPVKVEYAGKDKNVAVVQLAGTMRRTATPYKREKVSAIFLVKKVDGSWRQHRIAWAPAGDPRDEIDRMVELSVRLYNGGHPYKMVDRFFAEDVVLITANAEVVRGRTECRAFMKKMENMFGELGKYEMRTVKVEFLAPDTAIGMFDFHMNFRKDGSILDSGRHTSVLKKVDGEWQIKKGFTTSFLDRGLLADVQSVLDKLLGAYGADAATIDRLVDEIFTTNIRIFPNQAPKPMVGRDAIRAYLGKTPKIGDGAFVISKLTRPTRDVVIVNGTWRYRSDDNAKFMLSLKMVNGNWLIDKLAWNRNVDDNLIAEFQEIFSQLEKDLKDNRLAISELFVENTSIFPPDREEVFGRQACIDWTMTSCFREVGHVARLTVVGAERLTTKHALCHLRFDVEDEDGNILDRQKDIVVLERCEGRRWPWVELQVQFNTCIDPVARAGIKLLHDKLEVYFNNRMGKVTDEQISALVTDDFTFTTSRGRRVSGKRDFVDFIRDKQAFGAGQFDVNIEFKGLDLVSETFATTTATTSSTDQGGNVIHRGRLLMLVEKLGARWLMKNATANDLEAPLRKELQSSLNKMCEVVVKCPQEFGQFYTEDAIKLTSGPSRRVQRGRKEITEAVMRSKVLMPAVDPTMTVSVDDVKRVSPTSAILRGTNTITSPAFKATITFLHVYKRVEGRWLIHRASLSVANLPTFADVPEKPLREELQETLEKMGDVFFKCPQEFGKFYTEDAVKLSSGASKRVQRGRKEITEVAVRSQAAMPADARRTVCVDDVIRVSPTSAILRATNTINCSAFKSTINLIHIYKRVEGRWLIHRASLSVATLPATADAAESPLRRELQGQLDKMCDVFVNCPQEFGKFYTGDAVKITAGASKVQRGRKEISEAAVRLRATLSADATKSACVNDVQMVSATSAILRGTNTITTAAGQRRINFLHTYKLVEGRWLVKAASISAATTIATTADVPKRAPGALRKELQASLDKMCDVFFKCPQEFGKFYTEDAVKITAGASKVQRGRKEISEAAVRSRARLSPDGSMSACVNDVQMVSPTSAILRGTNTITSAAGQRSLNFLHTYKLVEGRWLVRAASISAATTITTAANVPKRAPAPAGVVGTLDGLKAQLKQIYPEPFSVEHKIAAVKNYCTQDFLVHLPTSPGKPKGREELLAILEETRALKWVARRKYTDFRLEAENFAVVMGTYSATSQSPTNKSENGNLVEHWRFVDGRWACCLSIINATKDPLMTVVEDLLEKFKKIFTTAPNLFPTVCTKDFVVLAPERSAIFRGTDALKDYQRTAPDWAAERHYEFDMTHVEAVTDDCLLARGSFAIIKDGRTAEAGGMFMVMKKEADGWKFHHVACQSTIDKSLLAEVQCTLSALQNVLNTDPVKTADYWTDDGRVFAPGQPPRYGKDGAAAANIDQVERGWTLPDFYVTFAERLSENVAMARACYKLVNTTDGEVIHGKLQCVMKKVDGCWLFHAAAW